MRLYHGVRACVYRNTVQSPVLAVCVNIILLNLEQRSDRSVWCLRMLSLRSTS